MYALRGTYHRIDIRLRARVEPGRSFGVLLCLSLGLSRFDLYNEPTSPLGRKRAIPLNLVERVFSSFQKEPQEQQRIAAP